MSDEQLSPHAFAETRTREKREGEEGGLSSAISRGGLAVGPQNRAVSVPLLRAAGRQARVRMLMTRRGGEAALAERAEQR